MTTDILFPVETINRELDYRIFLAARLAGHGRRVFIGRADELRAIARHGDGGVFAGRPFDPFFPTCDLSEFEMLKRRRYRVVHIDEEGAIFPGEEDRWRASLARQLDPRVLEPTDHVCTWGDFQRDYFLSLSPGCAANIRTTGTPRFDLYKERYRAYYQEDVERIRRELGDYILVNTNLAYANDAVGVSKIFSKRGGYDPEDPRKRLDHVRFWAHVSHVLTSFVSLITRLSIAFPETNFVVRPHPSENESFYRAVFAGAKNIIVRREGAVAPWLLSAKLMIHDGCTTAVEAAMCGLPIISYKAFRAREHDQYLPNLFGTLCTDEDDAERTIRELLRGGPDGGRGLDGLEERATKLLLNLTDESFPRMQEVLEAAASGAGGGFDGSTLAYRLDRGAARVREQGTELVVRPLSPTRRAYSKYSSSKFYGLRRADALGRLARAQRVLGTRATGTILGDALMVVEAS